MLNSENLSNQSFDEILADAVSKISEIYPEWSNHNSSDPGIMLLELFSWLKEVQQYHLNVLTEEHLRRFIKLLGDRPSPAVPADVYLKLTGSGCCPSGTLFFADSIPFETGKLIFLAEQSIIGLKSQSAQLGFGDGMTKALDGGILFYPFGKEEMSSDSFTVYISRNRDLRRRERLSLYFEIQPRQYRINEEQFPRYVVLKAECICGTEQVGAEIILDETNGLMKSGIMILEISADIAAAQDEVAVQITAASGKYAITPVITGVSVDVTKAMQQLTYTFTKKLEGKKRYRFRSAYNVEIYGVQGNERIKTVKFTQNGSFITVEDDAFSEYEAVCFRSEFEESRICCTAPGVCNFSFDLSIPGIIADSLELYIKEYDEVYRKWERVDDFDSSDKYSRCFVFKNGSIYFGDGERGMPPEGEICIVSCCVSMGYDGNIKKNAMEYYNSESGISAVNITAAANGRNEETCDECFRRIRKKLSSSYILASLEDYEAYIRGLPGIPVKRLRVSRSEKRGENEIVVALELFGGGSGTNTGCTEHIKALLDERTPIGTKITVLAPSYSPINVFASIETVSDIDSETENVKRLISDYLDSDKIGFGSRINKNELIRFILSGGSGISVKQLDMTISENDGKMLDNGDIKLKNNCLPKAENIMVTAGSG